MGGNPACTKVSDNIPTDLGKAGFQPVCACGGMLCKCSGKMRVHLLALAVWDGIPSTLQMHQNTDGERELIPKPGPECQERYLAVLSCLSALHLSCCTLVCLGDLGPSPGADLGHNFSYYLQTSCFNAYYHSIPLIFIFFNCFEFVQLEALFSDDTDGNIRSQHCEHKSCFLGCLL